MWAHDRAETQGRRPGFERRRRSAVRHTSCKLSHMKIVILRGGVPHADPRDGAAGAHDGGVLAMGTDDGQWVLLNVTPPVARQLDGDDALASCPGLVAAPERHLVFTDAGLDNASGLLGLRDGPPVHLYATPAVFEALTTSTPVMPVLQPYCGVNWHVIPVAGDEPVAMFRVGGMPGLLFTAIASNAPPPGGAASRAGDVVGSRIALAVHDQSTGQRVFFAPGTASVGADEADWMREADCLLVGGGEPTQWLSDLPARHKVILAERSDAEQLRRHGIALAYDGMEIDL
jgi:pyrroloquinoline quinone biosynthesis protein B